MPGWAATGSPTRSSAKAHPTLVITGASLGHLDIAWEEPGLALFLRSLASFPG
jgi:hypothetical protein